MGTPSKQAIETGASGGRNIESECETGSSTPPPPSQHPLVNFFDVITREYVFSATTARLSLQKIVMPMEHLRSSYAASYGTISPQQVGCVDFA